MAKPSAHPPGSASSGEAGAPRVKKSQQHIRPHPVENTREEGATGNLRQNTVNPGRQQDR